MIEPSDAQQHLQPSLLGVVAISAASENHHRKDTIRMNDNKLKQKVQRGGALFLVAVMCFTGLVGCGTKKPNKEPIKKPGTTQVEPNKKPTSNKTDSKTNTDKKDSSKVDIDKKDDKDAGKTDVDKKDDKGADQKDDKTPTTDVPAKAPVKNPSKDSGKQDTGATQTDTGQVPVSDRLFQYRELLQILLLKCPQVSLVPRPLHACNSSPGEVVHHQAD